MPSKQRPRITHSQNLGSSGTQDELPPAPSLAAPLRPVPWPALVFLAGVIAFEAWYMAPSLVRSWYFSSDEYERSFGFSISIFGSTFLTCPELH